MKGEKWGYVDHFGYWVIPARWNQVTYFSPYRTAVVAEDKEFYIIDDAGKKLAIPFFYDNAPDPIQFGFSRISDPTNRKIGYLSESGSIKIPPQWDYGTPFQNTLACVCNDCLTQNGEYREVGRGHWKIIDREGKTIRDLGPSSTRPDKCPMKVREWTSFEFPFVKQ